MYRTVCLPETGKSELPEIRFTTEKPATPATLFVSGPVPATMFCCDCAGLGIDIAMLKRATQPNMKMLFIVFSPFGLRWILQRTEGGRFSPFSGYLLMTAISPKGVPVLKRVLSGSPTTCFVSSEEVRNPVRPLVAKRGLERPSAALLVSSDVK